MLRPTNERNDMDQVKQDKGAFIAFKQRYKKPEDDRPHFTGRIAIPGTESVHRMALWAGKDKNGRVMFTGQAAHEASNAPALDQINSMAGVSVDAKMIEENNLKLRPGQIVLFTNNFRDDANPKRPNFYGRWHNGEKLVDISVWAKESKTGEALLAGQTQYRQPGKAMDDVAKDGVSDAELAHNEGEVAAERPRRARGGR